MFPSLDAVKCARLIKVEYKSNIKFHIRTGDWRELMRYLAVNLSRSQIFKEGADVVQPGLLTREGCKVLPAGL